MYGLKWMPLNTKFQKYMAVSRNFKNGPLSPRGGDRPPVAQATGDRDISVIFLLNFFFEQVPGGGRGAGGPVAPQQATVGPVAPPTGDRAWLPYLNPPPLSPFILFSKILEK